MQNSLTLKTSDLLQMLRRAILNGSVTQSAIAFYTGVDQSQISRILAGQVKRESENVLALCKYAEAIHNTSTVDPCQSELLMGALREVWDGSPEHAKAIAGVILSLSPFPRPT